MADENDLEMTPEQCRKTADSFADLPPEFQLSSEELEMVQEEALGTPMRYGSPESAIEAMRRRLALLKKDKAKTLETMEDCDESLRQSLLEDLNALNREIEATQQRLDGYQHQHRGRN